MEMRVLVLSSLLVTILWTTTRVFKRVVWITIRVFKRVILPSDRTKAHQVLSAKISCKNVIFPWVGTCEGPIDHIDANGSTSSDILMQPSMRDEIVTVAQQCLIYLTCWHRHNSLI